SAAVAFPPSPEFPERPLPAIRVSVPEGATLKTECRPAKYMFPEASTVTRGGSPIDVWAAVADEAGATPPATVEMLYCWAEVQWKANNREILRTYRFTMVNSGALCVITRERNFARGVCRF